MDTTKSYFIEQANKYGILHERFSQFLCGEKNIGLRNLEKIAKALSIRVKDLF